MPGFVRVERRDGTALLTLDRPPVNALDSALLSELEAALAELASDPRLRALVLAGAGKAFVAGADIAEMARFTAIEAAAFARRGQRVLERIEDLGVPTIAAVDGYALGGGCELAMACDIVLAGPAAVFGQPEVRLGVIPGFGGTQRLARRVGRQRALELCLTGRNVGAEEAVAIGLALQAVEGDVVEAACELAARIARNAPVAVRLARRAIHLGADLDLPAALAHEVDLFALCFSTDDQAEGMAAFLEKRRPSFTGR